MSHEIGNKLCLILGNRHIQSGGMLSEKTLVLIGDLAGMGKWIKFIYNLPLLRASNLF